MSDFRLFAIYWLIGCLLVGAADGMHAKFCPHDKPFSGTQMLALVAIWPFVFSSSVIDLQPPPKCEAMP